ncbi:MAG: ATP-binding cassette domain-containing protein [Bacteroidales bacterium]|nr:ATP-binding cassette domain-containing protein [Bacteroidales bacterium]
MNPKTLISPEEISEGSSARRILISLDGGVISNPLRRLPAPVSFQLRQGECIAVVGPVGSGKSTLLKMITGGFYLREGTLRLDLDDESYRAIRFVEFDNAYSTTETQYYHQQRWQAFEREASPLAGELLGVAAGMNAEGMPDGTCQDKLSWQQRLFEILNIGPLLGKEIITLSSGELRRFSIARALLQRPQVLVLESPFIGLDPPTRQVLCDLLEQVLNSLGISIIMTLTDPDRIPQVVTHAYYMHRGRLSAKMPAGATQNTKGSIPVDTAANVNAKQFFHEAEAFDKVVEMRNINISYGERQIFRDLNWTVRSGERWNVTGPNGSGKSTLLSLVNADNPRAYSLDITLFDRRRGTGESIWDIKRHIGYLSSEMHSSFRENLPVLEIVRSGLGDRFGGRAPASGLGSGDPISVKPGGKLTEAQTDTDYRSTINYGSDLQQNPNNQTDSLQPHNTEDDYLLQWLRLFGAEHLAQRSYLTLSSGEQRYILLIRAFVKDPDLLILDEPFQGLDPALRHRAATVIEAFCAARNKTLIFVTHYLDEVPGVVTHTLQL